MNVTGKKGQRMKTVKLLKSREGKARFGMQEENIYKPTHGQRYIAVETLLANREESIIAVPVHCFKVAEPLKRKTQTSLSCYVCKLN